MELQQFKETLLEFLSDVTIIPEKAKASFLNPDSWRPNKAPKGYNVLTDYILIKTEEYTRKKEKEKTVSEENEPELESTDEMEIFHYIVRIKFYTEEHCYYVSAIWKDYHSQYLGCVGDTYKPRPGEDWTRGNDLPDGEFCRETWNRIKNEILWYEIKPLSKYIQSGRYDNEIPNDQ